jgi:hypothetical protein
MEFQRDERVERRRARRRQVRRRRVAAVAVLGGVITLVALSTTSLLGPAEKKQAASAKPLALLPRGGTSILPEFRVVAFYGYPRSGERLGALGVGSPTAVAERLSDQALDYDLGDRRVLPAFELIATLVHDFPGEDGMYRSRLDGATIDEYIAAARQEKALTILDIQPGYADFMDEARSYESWLKQPDVSLALDPEWSMRPGQLPKKQIGSTTARKVNEVSAYLSRIVQENNLPEKLLLVHEFDESMIKDRAQIVKRPGVEIVFNVDGFGSVEQKVTKFDALTSDPERPAHVRTGFKLFYEEDNRGDWALMSPFDVLDLDPQPDVIVYE